MDQRPRDLENDQRLARCSRRVAIARALPILGLPAGIAGLVGGCQYIRNSTGGGEVASDDTDATALASAEQIAADPPLVSPGAAPPSQNFRPILPGVEPIVRIRIARFKPTAAARTLSLAAPTRWMPLTTLDSRGQVGSGLVLQSPAEISLDRKGWTIRDGSGHAPHLPDAAAIQVTPLSDDHREIRVDDVPYPGAIRLVAQPSVGVGVFDVINDVRLEDYIPGVLARELYPNWHPETFAAQAIAARSFACSEHQYYRGRRHYDLHNTTLSQVYAGKVDSSRAHDAVRRTRGMCLTTDDWLVPGYYSSSCGGRAATAEDAIGPHPVNRMGPLRGQPRPCTCRSLSASTWSVKRPTGSFSRRVAGYGRARKHDDLARLSTIISIDVIDTNMHGRPRTYRIRDDRGRTATVPASRLSAAANHDEPGLGRPSKNLRSGYLATFKRSGRNVVIDGRGFGHGAGLCQHGAEQLAKQGYASQSIVEWFYPDVRLRRAYV